MTDQAERTKAVISDAAIEEAVEKIAIAIMSAVNEKHIPIILRADIGMIRDAVATEIKRQNPDVDFVLTAFCPTCGINRS